MKKAIIFALTGLALVVTSFYSPIVCAEDTEDFLFQKNVTYSGVEGGKQGDNWKYPQFVGEKAVDGDVSTRWSADKTDNQWLTVDIGEEKTIGQVVLHFHAESPEYEVLVSNDNQNYQSIYKEERGSGGKEAKKYIEVANVTARYIKYQQLKMWKHTNGQYYGSSIISMEAYRQARLPDGIKFSIDSAEISEKRSKQLTYILTPTGVQVPEKQIEWSSSDPSIVNVDSQGRMKALKTGEAKVTVRIKNTDLSDTIPVTVIQEKAEYREMREKWKARLLGSKEDHEEFDQDSDVKKYRARIAKDSLELWQTLNKSENRTYLWEKKSSDTLSADYTTQFTNIKKLTLGYYDPSSSLHKNQEVFTQILKAIDFMIETKNYNGTYWSGNWWDWQIGSAQPLTDTLILLHDDLIEKDDAILTKFVEPLNHYAQDPKVQWPSYTATGANLTDISITVLRTAILLENDSRVEAVQSAVPSVLKMVTGGDGLYSDGSLIQHSHFPYNGSYGNELLKGFGRVQTILQGTHWEIKDDNINNLFQVTDKGYLQLMVNGKMPSMVSGRSISRAPGTNPFTSEFESGKETIANLTLVAKFSPEILRKKIDSSIKAWLEHSSYFYDFFENPRDFEALIDLKKIMNEPSITSKEERNLVNVYGSMDRVFQKNESYSLGISMYSSRIGNYEFGNTENKKGWHTADGMVYLYNGDLAQFDEGYWVTIDSYRLPGTTIDTKVLAEGASTGKKSPQSWVGGSNNGKVAAVGMFLDKKNENMDLVAKKSWFLLEDKLINLGSGISGTTNATIETILDNRMMDSSNMQIIQKKTADSTWINLTSTNPLNNLGYIFPNTMSNVDVQKEIRSGKYLDINEYFVNDQSYTKEFVKIIKNHGSNAQNDTYEYLTVAGKTAEEMAEMAQHKSYNVLANTPEIQAIETKDYLMLNAWSGNQQAAFVHVSEPASIIAEKLSNDTYRLSIANPVQNNKVIEFSIEKEIIEVIEKESEITMDSGAFLFDSKGLKGSSRSITIKVPSEVDKTALEKIVEENQNRNESDYTKESWKKVFTKAMELAQAVLTDPKATQAKVDDAVQAVRKAIEQLQEVTKVDKTALEKLVEENQNRNESDYTKESWKVFTKAMELAQAVLTDPRATQSEVDEAVQAVRKAIEQLQEVTKVDKTALEKIVEENQNRNESDYTKESWKVFTKAMELAQAVLTDPKATQAEVDDVVQAVRKAIEQLQEVTKVDKTALKKLVEENQNRVASGYTAESWQVFRKALEAAQAVLADSNTTQAEVDESIQAVNKAIEQLQEVTKVDKTALKKLVEENQNRVASGYTAESWQVFRKALEAAQAVLTDPNTTQAEVELVMNDLVQAIEQLENKETASSSEEDKNINNKAEQGKNTQEGNNEIGKSSISEETGKEGLLPKTGEKNNQVIQKLGYTILLVVFVSLFLLKGRKESKRSQNKLGK
ncbi:polysaccharide lyase family 8 super-sandwich domain-containing protein [Enterococcus hirae]|uniref:polysaccharide lyase family 8 super-sandwich domain-containing protein n=2 Tax=Enterococcus hirae TaxID=1354 RepID=UPI001361648A|nr:polysaccharide lyase family 8 super-sandwich domain-containing protein [Enterococcus hirae]NAA13070.1 LPXTG cell wall anchor domain-containing protein [Enterococcus hirae]NAA48181.1 LPXTG cell wall anchor domain-containing protein [Enterococcus hirae]NAA55624.1 LPXTG cell wall anchor domain-containing protein [Enterococcus hirae]NAB30186.1 LPXTG cell wall anchor domain-containing protein [Enterococcus hirae]NAB35507.1 LPXTG cell wall anchor domain-containing protein [Enterococcus hirae]